MIQFLLPVDVFKFLSLDILYAVIAAVIVGLMLFYFDRM